MPSQKFLMNENQRTLSDRYKTVSKNNLWPWADFHVSEITILWIYMHVQNMFGFEFPLRTHARMEKFCPGPRKNKMAKDESSAQREERRRFVARIAVSLT